MVRILGLDPGEKRIGVAVTDPLGITAQGLAVISFTTIHEALEKIEAICIQYNIERIVIGNPLNMNGTRGPSAEKAHQFADQLKKRLSLDVIMVDERLSTQSAEKTLISGGISRKKRKMLRDKLSAVLILETYMARHNLNHH